MENAPRLPAWLWQLSSEGWMSFKALCMVSQQLQHLHFGFLGPSKKEGAKSWKICEWYGDVGIRIKCNDLSQNNHCEPKFDRRDLYIHVTSQIVAMLKYVEYREISVVMLVCLFRGCPICCTSKWSMKVYHITCIVHPKSSQHISNSKLFPWICFDDTRMSI